MNIADWNWFDWVLIAILAVSMARAFMNGLVRAIFGLLGFVAGFELATWTYTIVGDRISDRGWIASQTTARIVAFLLIVAAVAVLFELLGRGLHKALRTVGLGPLDRLLGAAFGFGRGCLIGIALLMAATTFAPRSRTVATSVLSPYLFVVAHDVSFLVPQYIQELIGYGAVDTKHNAPHWINRH